MTFVVGLTGFAQVGKDAAAGFLIDEGFTRIAFADILRESVYNLNPVVEGLTIGEKTHYLRVQTIVDRDGWDRAKVEYPEIRQLLQRMGTEVGRELYGVDFWVERAMQQVYTGPFDAKYVVTDVRFPNECEVIQNMSWPVFRIERPGTGAVNSHVSDTGISALPVDGVIVNTGTLEEYRAQVLDAVLPLLN